LNSGVFWPRRSWIKYPGKVIFEFLPPIQPGANSDKVKAELETLIEKRSHALEQEAFEGSAQNLRSTDAFKERIQSIESAEQLVNDRQLLTVALGAFGLDEDIGNKFFIQKVLQEGTVNEESFANKLSDKRYFEMSQAFGFDLAPPNTALSTFADDVIEKYNTRQFEIAIGKTAPDMRLALALQRELPDIAGRSLSEDGKWFTIMANPPLRSAFERAFNLPASLGALDIDQQLGLFKERAAAWFGEDSVTQFADSEKMETLTRRFFASADTLGLPSSSAPGSTALALLQGSQTQSGVGLL